MKLLIPFILFLLAFASCAEQEQTQDDQQESAGGQNPIFYL